MRHAYLFLLLCLPLHSSLAVEMTGPRPSALGDINQRIISAKDENDVAKLIQFGFVAIKEPANTSINEELDFLELVAVRDRKKNEVKNWQELATYLSKKYQNDANAILLIFAKQRAICLDGEVPDRIMATETLKRAEKTLKEIEAQQALAKIKVWFWLGENYLSTPDPETLTAEASRDKAREYFSKVVDFPIFNHMGSAKMDQLTAVYTQAALRLVEITDRSSLRTLHFHPFVLEVIQQRNPGTAKLISNKNPWIFDLEQKAAHWLKSALDHEPVGSPTHGHLEAVQAYLKQTQPR